MAEYGPEQHLAGLARRIRKASDNDRGVRLSAADVQVLWSWDEMQSACYSGIDACELAYCMSGEQATIHVNDNIGDMSFNTAICATCAKVLEVREGGDLPERGEPWDRLKRHYTDNPTEGEDGR